MDRKGKEMTGYPRREFLTALAGSAAASFSDPFRLWPGTSNRFASRASTSSTSKFPFRRTSQGLTNKYYVAKVEPTSVCAAIRLASIWWPCCRLNLEDGNTLLSVVNRSTATGIRPALIGKDLFAIEDHLKAGG